MSFLQMFMPSANRKSSMGFMLLLQIIKFVESTPREIFSRAVLIYKFFPCSCQRFLKVYRKAI